MFVKECVRKKRNTVREWRTGTKDIEEKHKENNRGVGEETICFLFLDLYRRWYRSSYRNGVKCRLYLERPQVKANNFANYFNIFFQ